MTVKRLTAITTALILACSAAPAYNIALADSENECVYPTQFISELELENLADYAVFGDARAYAASTNLYIISPDEYGDEILTTVDCGFQLTAIDYDAEGNLYVLSNDNTVYAYPDMAVSSYVFTDDTTIDAGDYEYRLVDGSGELYAIGADNKPVTIFEEGCSNLKEYSGVVYVLNSNAVYALDGLTATRQHAEYTDFTVANNIYTGNLSEALTSAYSIKKVTLNPETSDGYEAYVTKIDLNNSGATFATQGTSKVVNTGSALAIAEVGNATIIVMPDENGLNQSYLTLSTAVADTDYSAQENDMTHAYALSDLTIYSRPYMCGETAIFEVEAGTVFEVSEKFSFKTINLQYPDDTFYRVTATVGGEEVTGYVAENLLTPYTFSAENEPENSTGTEGFTYDDNMRTVLIVLLIVLLVLVAAGYVTFYLTRKGEGNVRKGRKPKNNDDDLYS